jgi:positive regulator of sigma E activity
MIDTNDRCREIERHGVVTAVRGSVADIEIIQRSACSSCHIRALCVAGESAPRTVQAPSDGTLAPGMSVILSMDERIGWLGVVMGFVLPLMLVVTVLFSLRGLVRREEIAGLLALASLVPYYGALRLGHGFFDRVVQFRARPLWSQGQQIPRGHGADPVPADGDLHQFHIVRKEGTW